MEFLDIPLVRAILMGAAFGALVSWLFGRYVPYFNKRFGNVTSPDIEKMIDQLSDSDLSEIKVALDGNRKLEAIKYFRASTNAGLRDAKIAVERLIEQKKNAS